MKKRIVLPVLGVLFTLVGMLCGSAWAQTQYLITASPFNCYDGQSFNGLNNFGAIVGRCDGRGFVLFNAGNLAVRSPSGERLNPSSITDNGWIAGNYKAGQGFMVQLVKGKFVNFKVLYLPSTNANLSGMNQLSHKVGTFVKPDNILHGFFRDNSGHTTVLDYPGADRTSAAAINSKDQVVGTYTLPGELGAHGYLYDHGQYYSIDAPFDTTWATVLTGISNDTIVGIYYIGDPNEPDLIGEQRSFSYKLGSFSTIEIPNVFVVTVSGVNDKGQIIGNYRDELTGWQTFRGDPVTAPTLQELTMK